MIPFNRRQSTAQSQKNSINFNDYLNDRELFVPGGDYDASDPYYQLPISQPNPSTMSGVRYGLGQPPEPSPTIAPQSSIPQPTINRRAPAPKPPDIDYPSAYAKIIDKQNRPNRLEYEKMVKEGAPQIPQSRWARLGAALAGGGVTWATNNPAAGYQLGMSALEGPQKRSDEAYERKLKGFSDLARSEESDMSEKIKMLEFQQRNYLDQKNDWRADNADNRAEIMTDAQLEELALGRLKAVERTNGHTYLYDPKSKEYVADLGPTKFTPEQLTAHAVTEYKAKLDTEKPYKIEEENRKFEKDKSLIEIRDENAKDMLRERQRGQAELLITRLRGKINEMSPGDRYKDQYLKIIAAVENDPELADTNYITQDPNTGIIDVKPISILDSATTKAKKEKLHGMVAAGLDAAASPAAPTVPNVAAPSAVSPNTPKNYDGTIPIIGADGKPDNIPAADLQLVLDNGGKVNPAGVVKAPGATPPINQPTARPTGPELPRTGVTPTATAAKFGAMPPPMFGNTSPVAPVNPAPQQNINPFLPAGPIPQAPARQSVPPPVMQQQQRNVPPQLQNPIQLSTAGNPAAPLPPPNMPAPAPAPNRAAAMAPANPNPIMLGGNAAKPYANDIVKSPEEMMGANAPDPEAQFSEKFSTVKDMVQQITGLQLKTTSARRSAEKQAELYAQGRGKPGNIVTELDGVNKKSKHQTGEAADVIFVDRSGKAVKPSKKLWDILGDIAKSKGLEWGGDWKSLYDPGHVQSGSR